MGLLSRVPSRQALDFYETQYSSTSSYHGSTRCTRVHVRVLEYSGTLYNKLEQAKLINIVKIETSLAAGDARSDDDDALFGSVHRHADAADLFD